MCFNIREATSRRVAVTQNGTEQEASRATDWSKTLHCRLLGRTFSSL